VSNASRSRFAEAVRRSPIDLGLACLLIEAEVEPSVDVAAGLSQLDALAARVPSMGEAADRLRTVLGIYEGSAEDYADLRSSLLSQVLKRRRGLPILLSVVWLEVAKRAGIPAYGASLPGHFVVGLGTPDGQHQIVDPFRAGISLDKSTPAELWDDQATLHRILTNIDRWAEGPQRIRTRLWACELGLLMPSHPAELRRRHGELLVRTGDFAGGAAELEYYATAIDEAVPSSAETARQAARMARARLN